MTKQYWLWLTPVIVLCLLAPAPGTPAPGILEIVGATISGVTVPGVPGEDALAAAREQVRQVMAEAYASRDKADREALVLRLITSSKQEQDSALRFAMLDEAQTIAIDVGHVDLAVEALDQMKQVYAFEALDRRLSLVQSLSRSARKPTDATTLTLVGLDLLQSLMQADRFSDAMKLGVMLRSTVGKTQSPTLTTHVRESIRRVGLVRNESARAGDARQTLEQTPDDAQAHEVLGRYLAFYLEQWDQAMPHLLLSESSPLKALAEQEQADPQEAQAQVDLGHAWWALKETHSPIEADAAKDRARDWYRKAWPKIKGLSREALMARLSDDSAPITWAGRSLKPGIATSWFKFQARDKDRFAHRVHQSIEKQVFYLWKLKAPNRHVGEDYFAMHLQGWIYSPRAGRVRMRLAADDVVLTLNDQVVIEVHGNARFSTYLLKGYNAFDLRYYELTGYALLQWHWAAMGSDAFEPIPASAFFYDDEQTR